jgi:Tfp pilus assembly protein PilF
MTDNFWKKVNYLFGMLPILAIFAVLILCANVEIKDLDLWLHLAMGKFITLHKYVPEVDVLSCSIQGAPWVNHEWLFQVVVYNIYRLWDIPGLINMQVIIVSVTMMLLLFLGYSKERQLLTTVFLCLVFLVYQERFTMRPDLYSLLFFTVYIFVLSLHIDKRWAAPVLVVVQILWSNMHGFFFFGPLFVLIGIISEWVKRNMCLPFEWGESGRLTDEEYARIKKVFFCVILACLVNPLFVKGALYPLGVFFSLGGENKIFFKYIQELQKPITWNTIFNQDDYLYYKLLIALSFVSFVFNRRRIDISALLFWLVFLVFSLQAARNTPFFAFAAYLVFMTNILNVNYDDVVPVRFSGKKFQYLTAMILKLLFLVWIFGYYKALSARSYYDFDKYELKSEFGGISRRTYPDKAVDFLVENKVRGDFFNDFNSGAYLLGRTFPDIKVYIDGRTEVYGGRFFQNYQKIWDKGDVAVFKQAVEQFQITGALLNSTRHHIPKEILKYLYQDKEWHAVYFNYDAVIFLKDVAANRPVIDKFGIDLARWEAPEPDLFKLGALRVRPYQSYYRAYTLESLDLDEIALKELEETVRIDPFYADARDLMGKIYTKRKEYRNAFEHFRLAVTASPNEKEKRHNLALSYYDLGQYEGAVAQYKAITRMWPGDPKGHFLLTKSCVARRDYPQAVNALRQAHRLSPDDAKDPLELGDMMFRDKAYAQAKDAYLMALDTKKDLASGHKKLGLIGLATDDREYAKKEFTEALTHAPEDKEIQELLRGLNE